MCSPINRMTLLFFTIILGVGCIHPSRQPRGEAALTPPVTVYSAKQIITMDPESPVATAVAVSEGLIVAVGSRDEIFAELEGHELLDWGDGAANRARRQPCLVLEVLENFNSVSGDFQK